MRIGLETGAGHIASAMSAVNVLCDTYNSHPDAIVIMSKGHGALAQYVILNELGILPDSILRTYHRNGGLSEHSTLMPRYGIYASTGSLGHGLGIGIGYAIANPDRLVFVIMSDGELDEGSNFEAFKIINKLHLKNIIPVVDVNDWKAFEKFDEKELNIKFQKYYSVKGEGWGELENTLASHYAVITDKLYRTWKENFPEIEKKRLLIRKQYNERFSKRGIKPT